MSHTIECATSTFPSLLHTCNILLCLLLSSVKNLHDRWARDCNTFRELYNLMPNLEVKPRIDWGPLLDEKQVGWSFN